MSANSDKACANDDTASINSDKAWEIFRNIVSLAMGAEEQAMTAEREACGAAMAEGRSEQGQAAIAASEAAGRAQRYCRAARKYHEHLTARAKAGDEYAALHLRNAGLYVEKAERAEANATDAADAMGDVIGERAERHHARRRLPIETAACRTLNL